MNKNILYVLYVWFLFQLFVLWTRDVAKQAKWKEAKIKCNTLLVASVPQEKSKCVTGMVGNPFVHHKQVEVFQWGVKTNCATGISPQTSRMNNFPVASYPENDAFTCFCDFWMNTTFLRPPSTYQTTQSTTFKHVLVVQINHNNLVKTVWSRKEERCVVNH